MVEIKFRTRELLECMHRIDPELQRLRKELASDREIKAREKTLMPVYKQIAIKFMTLHDTPNRMAAKGVIKMVVDWAESRSFFFHRLKRRLAEESLVQEVQGASGQELSHSAALGVIREAFSGEWDDDAEFLSWSRQPAGLEVHLKELSARHVVKEMVALGSSDAALRALPQGLNALLRSVDASTRSQLVEELKQALDGSLD